MPRPRTGAAVGLAVLAALASVPLPRDPAAASCAAPGLTFRDGREQPRVTPGETVTLISDGYVDGCNDGGETGPPFGCGTPAWEQPTQDVELRFRQPGRMETLATADAENVGDELGHISWTVTIPADAAAGHGVLVPDGGERLRIRVAPEQPADEPSATAG